MTSFEVLRKNILKRDNYTCKKCKTQQSDLHVHHIVPKREGGLDSLQNLITLCTECHTKTHNEFAGKLNQRTKNTKQVVMKLSSDKIRQLKLKAIDEQTNLNALLNKAVDLFLIQETIKK